jgi:hypothetical protein
MNAQFFFGGGVKIILAKGWGIVQIMKGKEERK